MSWETASSEMHRDDVVVGLDIGQQADYSALSILEVVKTTLVHTDPIRRLEKHLVEGKPNYNLRYLERLPVGMAYPDQVERVCEIMRNSVFRKRNRHLVIDVTGVGRPIFDLFAKGSMAPIAVLIHGGNNVTSQGRQYNVPKRMLVFTGKAVLQTGRLRVPSTLKLKDTLIRELQNMRVKIDPATAHDSYVSWREREHDDLVLSLCIALWYVEQRQTKTIRSLYELLRQRDLEEQGVI